MEIADEGEGAEWADHQRSAAAHRRQMVTAAPGDGGGPVDEPGGNGGGKGDGCDLEGGIGADRLLCLKRAATCKECSVFVCVGGGTFVWTC